MLDMMEHTQKVYLACGATDMRKSINGLSSIVQSKFELSPFETVLFVFCNRTRDRLKILAWEENGFWVHFKRLERGHFMWPANEGAVTMNLTYDELMSIIRSPGIAQKLKGTDFRPLQKTKKT